MTVRQIITDYLKAHGCDGLCNPDGYGEDGCGCGIEDLVPCSINHNGGCLDCMPARLNKETGDYEPVKIDETGKRKYYFDPMNY